MNMSDTPQEEPSVSQVRAALDVLEASVGSGTLVPVNPGVVRAALMAARREKDGA